MKKFLFVGVLMGASMAASTSASAHTSHGNCFFFCGPSRPSQPSGPAAAPEIDPASAMSGLALLAGGLATLRGRRSKKN